MSRQRITEAGSSAAILLSYEILEQLGISVGDEVDVAVVDRTIVIRTLDAPEPMRTIKAVADSVFEKRRSAYEELSEGEQ